MKTILQRNTAQHLSILAVSLLLVFFLSCKKDMHSDTQEVPGQKPDLSTKVTSSVSGFVTDHNDAAVVGAAVKVGIANAITDRYGYFEIKNAQVVKEAATVTVMYAGYFKAIKTYMAMEGKAAFFRIKLLQKNNCRND